MPIGELPRTKPLELDAGRAPRRGKLRIYLGAAPGVGKTFAMLDEGWRRARRGTDVIVGYVETHGRARTEAQLRDLEVMPRRRTTYRGQVFEEMDFEAVLARHPDVVLVDELAHTCVPGSLHATRSADVEAFLAAGIDVITTVNVQHLESLNDVVEKITGITQRETVPDRLVRAADQIELVDMDPEALRRRMAHGNIYAPEKVDVALGNYFRAGNLTALRELALLWMADRVDDSLQEYLTVHGITDSWETRERVIVAVTGAPSGEQLIRRAARMASRAKAELLGVHVLSGDGLAERSATDLDRHRQLLEDLGGTFHEVVGSDVAQALTSFAEAERATQLVVGASGRARWRELLQGSVINAVARRAGSFDLHVISYEIPDGHPYRRPVERHTSVLSFRRRAIGWGITLLGAPLLTLLLAALGDRIALPGELMIFLMLVVAASTIGGFGPGLAAAVLASFFVNWYFTPPVHTLTVSSTENIVALAAFVLVGGVIAALVTQAAARTLAATRAAAEAEALARVAGGLLGVEDPVPTLLERLRATFDLDRASIEFQDPQTRSWQEQVAAARGGRGSSEQPNTSRSDVVELGDEARLVLGGLPLAAEDQRVLQAFGAQLRAALEQRRLRSEATEARVAAESDALRTALLRAVSHDLRSPLASIKASVSSLLQHDIEWSAEATAGFLATIDEESDRLDALVGNLLDMSRLESGVLDMTPLAVGWDEVVAAAISSLSEPAERLDVRVPESLPALLADPILLERAVANLLTNALHHTPPDSTIQLIAGALDGSVELRVIDRGPGVSPDHREQIFRAFQRLGDSSGSGVGLGLAVARGFVEAMGGSLDAEDTPGGGLTMAIRMPAAT